MNSDRTSQVRPTFLKVLCILSFVSCGIWMLYDLFSIVFWLINSSNSDQQDSSIPINQTLNFMAYSGPQSLKDIIIQLVSLTGILLMWKLRKFGFYIYLIAESFLYFEFIYLICSYNLDSTGATQIGFEMIWPLPLDIAFFIMYATQVKYMTNKV